MSIKTIAAELHELDTKRRDLIKKRDQAIRAAVKAGTKRSEIAETCGISQGRVFELTRDLKKKKPASKK